MIKTLMFVFVLALSWVWCADSHAYVRSKNQVGTEVIDPDAVAVLNVLVGCDETLRCFDTAVVAAANQWNRAGSAFRFRTLPSPVPETIAPPSCTDNQINRVVTVTWAPTLCGKPWGETEAIAVTSSWVFEDGTIDDADILFDQTRRWGLYNGPWQRYTADFRRVILHELGHVLGLDHPDDFGQNVRAIMNSETSTTTSLQPDDIAGVRAIYPPQVAVTKGALENPGPDASKTGIGVISGWVCEANRVEVAIGSHRLGAVYGTSRGDTRSICGDSNNGFVLLVNWNLFGASTHRVRLLADGHELVSRSVTVTTFGTDFLRGRDGDWWTITDWPTAGTEIAIRWTEALQNIEIMDITQPADPHAATRAQLRKLLGTWRVCYGSASSTACDQWTFTDDIRMNDAGEPYLYGSFDSLARIPWVVVYVLGENSEYRYNSLYLDIWDDDLGHYGSCEYAWFNLDSPARFTGWTNGGEFDVVEETCGDITGQGSPMHGVRIRGPQ